MREINERLALIDGLRAKVDEGEKAKAELCAILGIGKSEPGG